MKQHSLGVFNEETNVNFYGWNLIIKGFFDSKLLKKYMPISPVAQTAHLEKDHGKSAIDVESWNELGRDLLKKLHRRAIPLQTLIKEHEMLAGEIYEVYSVAVMSDLSQASNRDFLKWFEKMWASYIELNGVGLVPVASDYYHSLLSKELESILRKRHLTNMQLQTDLNILMSPDEPNTAWHEQLEFLKLVHGSKSISTLQKSVPFLSHIKKYQWFNYGYQGPRVKTEDFLARAAKLLKEKRKISKELLDHQNYYKRLARTQRALEKKVKLSPTEKYLFASARAFTYLKGCRVDARHYFHFASDLIFEELGRRLKLPISFFRFAEPAEIRSILMRERVDKQRILRRCQRMLWVFERRRGAHYIPQGKMDQFLKRFVRKEETVVSTEVAGQIAFLGRAMGKAKIVNSVQDINKVEHGDILVSITTNPDLLPAMYKAIAFVTDIGGITSHAAIVAREMKKPCVTGTRFASKIFKDGDMIEVDAEKGIVRKI